MHRDALMGGPHFPWRWHVDALMGPENLRKAPYTRRIG